MRVIRHRLGNRIRGSMVIVLSILLVGLIPLDAVFAASTEVSIPYRQTWTTNSSAVSDTFEYRLTSEDGAPLPDEASGGYYSFTAKGNATGSIKLNFPFAKPGYYNYLIRAYIPDRQANYSYDEQTYKLMIMVVNTDSGLGVGAMTIQDEDLAKYPELQFSMSYTSPEVPDPGGGGAGGGAGGAAAGAAGGGGAAGGAAATTVIPNGDTPTTITDPDSPKSIIPDVEHWALLNLILTILTVLLAIIDAVLYFRDPEDKYGEEYEYKDEDVKRHGLARILAVIVAIVSILVFLLTEDMTQPMEWVDEYTVWMLLLFIGTALLTMMSKKEVDEDEYPEGAG